MRTKLKGINRVRTWLADGAIGVYYYAWKGGPRLRGEPGSPEFHQSYVDAHNDQRRRVGDTLDGVLKAFSQSADFGGLATRIRDDYTKKIKQIEKKFGDLPLAALTDRRTRGLFLG